MLKIGCIIVLLNFGFLFFIWYLYYSKIKKNNSEYIYIFKEKIFIEDLVIYFLKRCNLCVIMFKLV